MTRTAWILGTVLFALTLPASAAPFTPYANGTVYDATTHLLWQQGENPRMPWPSAREFCANLELGDNSNWRLPNRTELHDLAEQFHKNPSGSIFPDAHSTVYWTGDEASKKFYGVNFASGDSFVFGIANLPLYVRCVTRVTEQPSLQKKGPSPAVVRRKPAIPDPLAAVRSWAEAWSQQNIDEYLACYSLQFALSTDGSNRKRWISSRKRALSRPEWIQVSLNDLQLSQQTHDRSTVSFVQHYRSNTYSDVVKKELHLIFKNGKWRIVSEKVIDVL